MATKIEWSDVTDNIIVAEGGGWWCRKSSPACDNCYAEALNRTPYYGGNGLPYTGQPPALKLRRDIIEGWARQRKPKKHFVESMSDVFGPWVPKEWQYEMLDGMRAAPAQTFQVLTKWPHLARRVVYSWLSDREILILPQNIWFGFTAENQEWFDIRWPHARALALISWPGFTVFASLEPLLGAVTLPDDFLALGTRVQVIAGGESGHKARPMHPDWPRRLRDQCQAAGVPFFFKQHGQWAECEKRGGGYAITMIGHRQRPTKVIYRDGHSFDYISNWDGSDDGVAMERVGKKEAGRLLDGVEWSQFPA